VLGFGLGIKAFRAHAPPCNPGRLQGRYFKSWGPISMVSILICLRHLIRCLVLQIRGIPRVGIAIVIRTYGQRAVRLPNALICRHRAGRIRFRSIHPLRSVSRQRPHASGIHLAGLRRWLSDYCEGRLQPQIPPGPIFGIRYMRSYNISATLNCSYGIADGRCYARI